MENLNKLSELDDAVCPKTDVWVHYWELGSYNSGYHVGRFFDLEGVTADDHQQEIADWLEELTEKSGELCEEIILGDTEGVPSDYVGQWSIDPEFFDYQEFVDSTHLDKEVVDAGIYLNIPLENIEEAYRGQYSSDADFAECFADELGLISDSAKWPEYYIDWDRAACDLMMDHDEHNGHYFSSNY